MPELPEPARPAEAGPFRIALILVGVTVEALTGLTMPPTRREAIGYLLGVGAIGLILLVCILLLPSR